MHFFSIPFEDFLTKVEVVLVNRAGNYSQIPTGGLNSKINVNRSAKVQKTKV